MRFRVVMLSGKLHYVQHIQSRKFYFERYVSETDAQLTRDTLEEKDDKHEQRTLLADFFVSPQFCSTVFGCVGETPKELVIINDENDYWLIEHEETHRFLIFKYTDAEQAQKTVDNMLTLWANDPKAKAKAMDSGYFVSSKSFIRTR